MDKRRWQITGFKEDGVTPHHTAELSATEQFAKEYVDTLKALYPGQTFKLNPAP